MLVSGATVMEIVRGVGISKGGTEAGDGAVGGCEQVKALGLRLREVCRV